jgi:hypothetical protein
MNNTTTSSIFGKVLPSNHVRVYTEFDNNGLTKRTPKHVKIGEISDFYEGEADEGLEIIKENLDVEILECDR